MDQSGNWTKFNFRFFPVRNCVHSILGLCFRCSIAAGDPTAALQWVRIALAVSTDSRQLGNEGRLMYLRGRCYQVPQWPPLLPLSVIVEVKPESTGIKCTWFGIFNISRVICTTLVWQSLVQLQLIQTIEEESLDDSTSTVPSEKTADDMTKPAGISTFGLVNGVASVHDCLID